jgi:hypothetical protein
MSGYESTDRFTEPFALMFGEVIGIEFERHYALNFFSRRTLQSVDQRPQIALIDPPALVVTMPPSTTGHLFRPYVVDEGQEREAYYQGDFAYRWRYRWYTRCKCSFLRVDTTYEVVIRQLRSHLYSSLRSFHRWCSACQKYAEREVG